MESFNYEIIARIRPCIILVYLFFLNTYIYIYFISILKDYSVSNRIVSTHLDRLIQILLNLKKIPIVSLFFRNTWRLKNTFIFAYILSGIF